MKQGMKYSFIALSTVMALGFGACTEDVDYTPAGPVASDCIKASFAVDNAATVFSPTDANAFSLPIVREVTDGEATVLVKPTHVNNGDVFQIPESVTFAAGEQSTTLDVTFEVPELEEEYTYSFELEEAAYDPYSEATVSTSTGTVLKQADWNQTLGTTTANFAYFGTESSLWSKMVTTQCSVLGTSDAATWYKLASPIEEGNDIVFKVNEDGTVRVRRQQIYMADISNLLGYSYPPTPCYVSLNGGYTGQLVGVNVDGQAVGFPANTYDAATGRITVVLDYTCVAGTITTAVTSFVVPAAE